VEEEYENALKYAFREQNFEQNPNGKHLLPNRYPHTLAALGSIHSQDKSSSTSPRGARASWWFPPVLQGKAVNLLRSSLHQQGETPCLDNGREGSLSSIVTMPLSITVSEI